VDHVPRRKKGSLLIGDVAGTTARKFVGNEEFYLAWERDSVSKGPSFKLGGWEEVRGKLGKMGAAAVRCLMSP